MKLTSFILLAIVFFVSVSHHLYAQTAVNATGASADVHAMLDVKSGTQGFLPPRLTAGQRITLAGSLTIAQRGMEVADASSGKLFYWTGVLWSPNKTYIGVAPIAVTSSTKKIGLNAGTAAGDLITWDGNNWVNKQPDSAFSINVDNRQPVTALNYCISLYGLFPSRNESAVPYIGELELFSFSFAPKNFAYCNGQLINISSNTALFSLLGTYYGGNGQTTFALPDLRGRVPVTIGSGAGLSSYSIGNSGGTESNTLVH